MHLKLIYNNEVFFYEEKLNNQEKFLSFFNINELKIDITLKLLSKHLTEPFQKISSWLNKETENRKNREKTNPFEGIVEIFNSKILVNLYQDEDDIFFYNFYECYFTLKKIIEKRDFAYLELYNSLSYSEYLILNSLNKEATNYETLYSMMENESHNINHEMIENLKLNKLISINSNIISITDRGNRIKLYTSS